MESPYEYYEGKLGVQGRFLFDGDNAHPDSLRLIGERGLQMRIEREKIIKIRAQGPNSPMLVSFDSLPCKWQEAIVVCWGEAQKLAKQTMFEKYYVRDMLAFEFYSTYKFPDMYGLDRETVEKYTINASVLKTLEKVMNERKKLQRELHKGRLRKDFWETLTSQCTDFKATIEHNLPEETRRLREKFNGFKKEGYSFLIHKGYRSANALVVNEEYEALLKNLYSGLDYKPNYTETSRLYDGFLSGYVPVINNTTGEVYNPKDFKKLSHATVWNWLTKWENRIGTHLARSGNRQDWMQRYKPYHSLKRQDQPGDILSIDDRQPPFVYDDKGHRVWFYCGVDVGSEAFTSWSYGTSKEGIIAEFYRQMVRNYAMWGLKLPYELECESSLNSSYKDTLLKDGNMFERVRIEANNARGKVIESYWRQLRYGAEKQDLGWIARPFARDESNQARTDKKTIIPFEEIVSRSLSHLQTWNNMEHSKIKGMSRWDVFLTMQHPKLKPINYHGILPYIGFTEKSSVRAGMINFRSDKFLLGMDGIICTGDRLINLMKQVEGRDIVIRWIDNNFAEVLKAYIYIDDRFVCEAVPQPSYRRGRIDQDETDLVNRELMSKYVNTIESFAIRQKKGLDKLTIIDNRPVTINNSFKIFDPNKGMQIEEYIPGDEPAKRLPDVDGEAETVLTAPAMSFVKDLKNNF